MRPWWWLALAAAVVVPDAVGMAHDIAAAHRHRAAWPRVTAQVADTYESGRHQVEASYRHPVTEQDVDVDVVIVDAELLPRPGGTMTLGVDPANPDEVVVPGDGDPVRDLVLEVAFFVGVALVASLVRWWSMRRTERLITSGRPAFAMLAVLHDSGWNPRRIRCSLYPLDGRAGVRPVCTFDVLTTGGLPIGGPAFAVEVRGRPLPGGLLVARSGDHVIRPVRRPLARGTLALRGPTTSQPRVLATAPPPFTPIRTVARLHRSLGVVAPLAVGAIAVATAVAIPTVLVGERRDERLGREGDAVIAELVGKDDDQLKIRYRPAGAEADVEATVVGSPDRVVGRRYPAHTDAAGRVRLDADPYNTVGPLGWLIAGWLVAALVTWPRIRWWRDARRAGRDGPWYQAVGHAVHGNLRLAAPGDPDGAFTTSCETSPTAAGPPRPVLVAGSLEPRDAVAVAGPYRSAGPASTLSHLLRRDAPSVTERSSPA